MADGGTLSYRGLLGAEFKEETCECAQRILWKVSTSFHLPRHLFSYQNFGDGTVTNLSHLWTHRSFLYKSLVLAVSPNKGVTWRAGPVFLLSPLARQDVLSFLSFRAPEQRRRERERILLAP